MRFGTKRFNPVFANVLMDSVVFSTGGFGGYDGAGTEDDDDLGGGGDDSDESVITLEEDGNAADDLFKPEDGKEDDEESDDSDDPVFPTQEEVTADLKSVLEGYDVPDDLIPEDLDMGDRKQVRAFATAIGRHAVQSALGAMFKPIQIAMSQQQHELRKEIKQSVSGGFAQSKEEEILLEVIPAAANKADRKVIDVIYAQAKIKHPKDMRKAAAVTRDAIKAMGMNPNGRKTPGKNSGKSGLDLYAPALPQLDKPTQRNADRLRRPAPK